MMDFENSHIEWPLAPGDPWPLAVKKIRPLMTRKFSGKSVDALIAASKSCLGSLGIPDVLLEHIRNSNSALTQLRTQLDMSNAAIAQMHEC